MPEYRDFVPRQGFQPTLALSPDAGTVAYSSNAGGRFDLWIISVTGGEPRRVTDLADQAVRQIAWAPDGKSLVFTADREGDEQYRLYRIGLPVRGCWCGRTSGGAWGITGWGWPRSSTEGGRR